MPDTRPGLDALDDAIHAIDGGDVDGGLIALRVLRERLASPATGDSRPEPWCQFCWADPRYTRITDDKDRRCPVCGADYTGPRRPSLAEFFGDSRQSEGLDVELLARALQSFAGQSKAWRDLPAAKSAERIAAEYARLATGDSRPHPGHVEPGCLICASEPLHSSDRPGDSRPRYRDGTYDDDLLDAAVGDSRQSEELDVDAFLAELTTHMELSAEWRDGIEYARLKLADRLAAAPKEEPHE